MVAADAGDNANRPDAAQDAMARIRECFMMLLSLCRNRDALTSAKLECLRGDICHAVSCGNFLLFREMGQPAT
jgi:hypothetical protein